MEDKFKKSKKLLFLEPVDGKNAEELAQVIIQNFEKHGVATTREKESVKVSGLNIENELVNERTLSKLLDISIFTLRYWRFNNKGPKFIKLDNKRVRYPKQNILDWYASQTKQV